MIGIDTCFLVDLDAAESPRHAGAEKLFREWLSTEQQLAVCSNVFLEYQHIMTDSKRFTVPLTMSQAIDRTWYWSEQSRIHILYPDDESFKCAQVWLSLYHLGRNRLIDTHMAAIYARAGVTTLWTANAKNFEVFNMFALPEYY
jgi:predicted nucleic acid-binding protein